MPVRLAGSIEEISAAEWNALDAGSCPFLRHEFLSALEQERCADASTGWLPCHLLLTGSHGKLTGAVPLYLKRHSWGEFVFDWSWANAYARSGLEYYPKLLSAIPFTPAPGCRLLVSPDEPASAVRRLLAQALVDVARERDISSVHVLFTNPEDQVSLLQAGFLSRVDCQFHWLNRGYDTYEDFLSTFRADKRKKTRRERRRVREMGIHYRTLSGAEIDDALWDTVYALSAGTFARHGHEHYLTAGFFRRLSCMLPDSLLVKLALDRERPVAAAVFFVGPDTLYGRYWGASADYHSLHFETCYHQGIDFCIERGLKRFEPGTQGEHKLARGFEPVPTWSAHWIADARFARAIGSYLTRERAAVEHYMAAMREHVPYHRELDAEAGESASHGIHHLAE